MGQNAGPNRLANFQKVLQNRVPGLEGVTTYPGADGTIGGIGFTSSRADLFQGQTPSTLSGVTASLRQLPLIPGANPPGPPGSVTGQLALPQLPFLPAPGGGGDNGGVDGIGSTPVGSVTGVTGNTLGMFGGTIGTIAGPPGSGGILGAAGQAVGNAANPSGVVSVNTGQGYAPAIALDSTPAFSLPGTGFNIPSLPTSHTLLSNIDTFQNLTPDQIAALGPGQSFSGTTANPNNTMTGAQGPISTNFTGGVNSPTASMNARAPAFSGIGAIGGPRGGDSPTGASQGDPSGVGQGNAGNTGVGQAAGNPAGVTGGETGAGTTAGAPSGTGADASSAAGVGPGEATGIDGGNDGGPGGGGSGGGDGSVICTLFRDKGIENHRTWLGTARFGAKVDDDIYAGYLRWAAPLVAYLRQHPTAWRLFYRVFGRAIRAGIAEMAHREGVRKRGSRLGAVILAVALPVCRRLGRGRHVRRRVTATA